MKYDGKFDIAIGAGRNSTIWKNTKSRWSEFVEKLSVPVTSSLSKKEYESLNKDDRATVKDVGGYVGGYLRAGRRKPENIIHRQLITLDIDFARLHFWEDFKLKFDCAAVLHSTLSHTEEKPRFRLIIPASRDMTGDEYLATSRKLAGILGIELFDNTTFEINRLMFWPSHLKDLEYYFEYQDGPWLEIDKILKMYVDWTDINSWPTNSAKDDSIKGILKKQENPHEKKGIVGSFCRTYSIEEAIEKYLTDEYEKTTDDRYTYKKGSTSSGVVVYDGLFLYSHHGTDPCSGKLCNAFDAVRIHKFGHLDVSQAQGKNAKSYRAMEDLARKDENVKRVIGDEKMSEAKYEFADGELEDLDNYNWLTDLEVDGKGNYLSSAANVNKIIASDSRIKGRFKENLFDNKRYVTGDLPWRTSSGMEPMKNVDYSGLRNYIETIYGIQGNLKIDDSLAIEFERNSFHPIRDYLESVEWDGNPRIDSLLVDYFGAEDNAYSHEAIRKPLVGAVARIFEPGIKFDLVLTLAGSEGTGKSTFISKLGKEWFSDTFLTVHGKEALEQIQGAWLVEIAELAGLRKAEVESIKHFITKQEDMFRPAYARTSELFKRQCVFFGTTNNREFLKDPSGNRRFMPIDVNEDQATKSVFHPSFDEDIDQIWAEAYHLYKSGERLYLSPTANKIANRERKSHSQNDGREGIIQQYLDTLLPPDWEDLDLYQRRSFLTDPLDSRTGEAEKDYVCIAEIWCECLGKDKNDMSRYNTREINDIMRSLEEWEPGTTRRFSLYGTQKCYMRKLNV